MNPISGIGSGTAQTLSWFAFFAIIDTNFVYENCPVPTGLQLLGLHDLGVTATWNAGTDTLWEVSLVQAGTAPDEGLIVETANNYYHFDSLDSAVVYEIYVRALCDGDIYGPWSEPLQFLSYCEVPEALQVVSTNVGKVVLAWQNNALVQQWEVEIAPEGTEPGNGTIVPAPIYFTACNGLDTATWHWARVRAVCDEEQYSDWTDTVMFYIPGDGSGGPDTNINDTTTAVTLAEQYTYLMPNPAREEVTVMSSFRVKAVELYGADGKLLQHREVNAVGTTLDLEGLPAGTYFVRVVTHAGVTTKRLIIE